MGGLGFRVEKNSNNQLEKEMEHEMDTGDRYVT